MTILTRATHDSILLTAPNGRELGEIFGETYFTKRTENHFFVKFNGFGLSREVIEILYKYKVKWVVFNYKNASAGTQQRYRTTLACVEVNGIEYVDNTWSKEDPQLILAIEHMEKTDIQPPRVRTVLT